MLEEINEQLVLARKRTALATERSRQANERTFLAWMRTGLASVAGGLAIIRFLTFQTVSHQTISQLIGCTLVVLGIAIFYLSYMDYKSSCKQYQSKNGYAGSLWSISVITFVLIAVSIVLLFIAFKPDWLPIRW